MLTDKEFLVFLNDKSLNGSIEERLGKIIDEEMEKPEKEMDTELIEYCLDRLTKIEGNETDIEKKKGNGDSDDKRIKFNAKRFFAIATVAVLLVGTISASAIIFDVNLFDGIVEIYNDYIRINFDKTDNTADDYQLLGTELAKELADNGFDRVLLPEVIFSTDYELTDINYEADEYMNSANITLKYQNKFCNIDITQFSMKEIVPDVEFLNVTSEIKEIKNDNVTIYCFMQDKSAAITYRDGLSVYFIQIPMNLDKAIEVAETIK